MTRTESSATDRAPADDEPGLRDALASPDARVRRDAALALVDAADAEGAAGTGDDGGSGLDDATVDALAGRVREDDDPDVRQFAVEALGVAGERVDAVRAALADDSEWVRAEAVVAHSRVAPGTHDPLVTVLEADDAGPVRRNAVVALGKTAALSQDALVERIKTDPHPPVREYAAQFLPAVVDDREAAERVLAAVLAREPNAFVRAKAAESLGALGSDRAEDALETHGVTDASDDVARAAERALADVRGVDPDALDVDRDDDAPGPGRAERHGRGGPTGERGPGSESHRGQAPGGAPGFDPDRHLDAGLDDRT